MIKYFNNRKGLAGLLQILIAIIITSILYVIAMKSFLKGPVVDEEVEKSLSEEGVKTNNPVKIIDKARENVDAVNKKQYEQYKQFDKE